MKSEDSVDLVASMLWSLVLVLSTYASISWFTDSTKGVLPRPLAVTNVLKSAACSNPECVRCVAYDSVFKAEVIRRKMAHLPNTTISKDNRVYQSLVHEVPQSDHLLLDFNFLQPRKPLWGLSEVASHRPANSASRQKQLLTELQTNISSSRLLEECMGLLEQDCFIRNETPQV